MNYLSGAFSYIAGADTDSSPRNVVPRLVDRIVNSALPHDRRAAVVELASVARESPRRQAEIGEVALKAIYAVLEQDKEYDDTLHAVLDLLINLCGCIDRAPDKNADRKAGDFQGEPAVVDTRKEKEEDDRVQVLSAEAAATNVDAFLGIPNSMLLLLDLLEHPDLFIKCSILELLTAMAANARATIQAAVLGAPQGVARLADLLDDPNPMVRTNTVLVLSALSEGSPEICKIVTFSGVVETLFRSIQSAASSSSSSVESGDEPEALEAAIVAQDALQLVSNLLSESSASQSYMRDSGCIPRLCAILAHAVRRSEITSVVDVVKTGPAAAIAQHEFRNVILALNCVKFLVHGDASESALNKTACASSGILKIVLQLCFGVAYTSDQPERVVLRASAILTAAALVRGHEECRSIFSAPISTIGGQTRSRSPQLLTFDVVTSDHSPSVRAASQRLLTDSLIADAELGLPATAFLNALVTGAGESRDNGSGGLGSRAPVPSLNAVAAGLKSTVLGWPNEADGAGVFYAACVIGWVALRVRGARERLLGSYASGSGDTLLARVVRALGYAHRENGPPPVRIGLLRLLCSWLYRSPSAISAFLSSALHLPLIVELANTASTRGDVSACHVQGLAAYVLAICLECAEEDSGIYSENSGFVSGTDGASVVIPRATLADIVRSRIGMTVFLSRMDELRASSAYGEAWKSSGDINSPIQLARSEISAGVAAWKPGDLGHELWYDNDFAGIIDDVYRRVSSRILKLMAEDGPGSRNRTAYGDSSAVDHQSPLATGTNSKMMSSRGAPNGGPASITSPMAESGSQAEVLSSFKDLIRTQDISLKEANLKIQELEAGLREAQTQLDTKNRLGTDGLWRSEREDLVASNGSLVKKIADLEAVLEEKTRELSSLSDAYTALEADRGEGDADNGVDGTAASEAELQKLRIERTAALSSLSAERDKVSRLEDLRSKLELEARRASAERQAAESEANALRAGYNGLTEFGDILEWKRRAELAEAQNSVHAEALDQAQLEAIKFRDRLRSADADRDELSSKAQAATAAMEMMKTDAAQLHATRKREIQMAREASAAAERAAAQEIASLRKEVADLKEKTAANTGVGILAETENELARSRKECDMARAEVDRLSTALTDVRNSVEEWHRRAETARHEKEQIQLEFERTTSALREFRSRGDDVQSKLDEVTNENSSAARRVADLEEKCSDLEEIRRKLSEEADQLRDEVAARSEQTIRLSGQVYEAEEARAVAESSLERVNRDLADLKGQVASLSLDSTATALGTSTRSEDDAEYIASLNEQILVMREKIGALESSLVAQANDETVHSLTSQYDTAKNRVTKLEAELAAAIQAKNSADLESRELRDRVTTLEEAEASKRILTEKVGELQAELMTVTQKLALSSQSDGPLGASVVMIEKEKTIASLRVKVDEQALRLKELEFSLDTLANGDAESCKKVIDLEKHLKEAETLLSVVVKEKSDQAGRLSEMDENMAVLAREKEELAVRLDQRTSELEELRNTSVTILDTSQAQRISELEEEVLTLRSNAQAASERLQNLETEVSTTDGKFETLAAQLKDCEHEREEAIREVAALRSATSKSECEIRDLKQALSDAAKSFKAASKELSSREELLVSMSADKTMMASDLAEANKNLKELQDEIVQITSTFAAEKAELSSKIAVAENEVAILRDGSAAVRDGIGHGIAESLTVTNSAGKDDLSVTVALIEELESKISALEEKHHGLHTANSNADANIRNLTAKWTCAQEEVRRSCLSEAAANLGQRNAEARVAELLLELESQKRRFDEATEALHTVNESEADRSQARKDAESRILDLENEMRTVRVDLSEAISAKRASEEIAGELRGRLESSVAELSSLKHSHSELMDGDERRTAAINDLEESLSTSRISVEELTAKLDVMSGERNEVRSRLLDNERCIAGLRSDLKAAQTAYVERESGLLEELKKQRALSSVAQDELDDLRASVLADKERSSARIKELELELEEQSEAVEEAERHLRDANATVRQVRTEMERRIQVLEEENMSVDGLVKDKENEILNLTLSLEHERSIMSRELENAKTIITGKDDAIVALNEDTTSLREKLKITEDRLADAESTIGANRDRVESILGEVETLRAERDSQSATVSELVETAKSREAKMILLNTEISRLESATRDVEQELCTERKKSTTFSEEVERVKAEAERLRGIRARLEDELDGLRVDLDSTEAARLASEKDNEDLRAWVSDLEEQAQGLHSLVEKFEDVERSLDEAVEAHSTAMQANFELTAELEALRTELATVSAHAKTANADKLTAETARHRAEEQVTDLEARIQSIRTSHVQKLTATEDMIRSNMTRCAELESALAAAERQLAESAMLSDKLFALEAQLSGMQADAELNLSRAKNAENEVEAVNGERSRLEKELDQLKASSGGEAYAELLAEHNELLVCLADLELECALLKENTLAGGTNVTNESVSVR